MMTLNAIVLFAIVCTQTFLRQTQKNRIKFRNSDTQFACLN